MDTTTGRKITVELTEDEFNIIETAVRRWRNDAFEFVQLNLGPKDLPDTLLTLVDAWSRINDAWMDAR